MPVYLYLFIVQTHHTQKALLNAANTFLVRDPNLTVLRNLQILNNKRKSEEQYAIRIKQGKGKRNQAQMVGIEVVNVHNKQQNLYSYIKN